MTLLQESFALCEPDFYRGWLTTFDGANEQRKKDNHRSTSHEAAVRARTESPLQSSADIVVRGLLLPHVPEWFDSFGLVATGYDDLLAQIERAGSSRNRDVYLWCDSGGGMVRGIDPVLVAMRELRARKNIVAHIDGMSASAAYWITSFAHEIGATRLSEVGGIGAYSAASAGEKDVVVFRSALHKAAGLDGWTDEQRAAVQDIIDRLGGFFLEDILKNRDVVLSEVNSGRVWLAAQARDLNLITYVADAAELETEKERKKMSEELTEKLAAVEAKLAEAETKLKAHEDREAYEAEITAAFAADPAFAASVISEGKSLAEAQAMRIENLEKKLAEQQTPVAIPVATAPETTTPADATEDEPQTYAVAVRAYMAEHACTAHEAATVVNRKDPNLRANHIARLMKGKK